MSQSTPPEMSGNAYLDLHCSVARSLELIGERWTFLILRDTFYGVRRFDDFQSNLGIARNILTARLTKLVDHGILAKVPYNEHPPRYEYRLTDKGRELVPVLTAIMAWGDKWEMDGEPPVTLTHRTCGEKMHTRAVCDHCGGGVDSRNLLIDPIPSIVLNRAADLRS